MLLKMALPTWLGKKHCKETSLQRDQFSIVDLHTEESLLAADIHCPYTALIGRNLIIKYFDI